MSKDQQSAEALTEDENFPRVITVNWDQIGQVLLDRGLDISISQEVRQTVEKSGGVGKEPSVGIDRGLVSSYARFVHPDTGPLSPVYVPYTTTSFLIPAFRKANDLHPSIYNQYGHEELEGFDSETFCSAVPDLAAAAEELTERFDDWYDGRHPIVEADGRGSSALDTVYVRFAVPSMEALDSLSLEGLPIEQSSALFWEVKRGDHYTVICHHEDRPVDSREDVGTTTAVDYADRAGILDFYDGPRLYEKLHAEEHPIFGDTTALHDDLDYPASAEAYVGDVKEPLPPLASLCRVYAKERDGGGYISSFQWVESALRSNPKKPPFNNHVYLFEGKFDADSIRSALLLDRHHLDEPFGDVYPQQRSASSLCYRLESLTDNHTVKLEFGGYRIAADVSEPADVRDPEITDEGYDVGGLAIRFSPNNSEDYSWIEDSWKVSDITVYAEKRREWTMPVGDVTRFPGTDSEKRVDLGALTGMPPLLEL